VPPPAVARPWGWMTASGVLALVVLLQWLSWPSQNAATESLALSEMRTEKEQAEQAAVAARAETARLRGEMQKQLAKIREEEAAKRSAAQAKQLAAEKQAQLAEQRAQQAAERLKKELDFLAASDELVKLNRPEADYLVRALNNRATLTLVGKVGTLRVEAINNSLLDASRLEAKNIVFYQGIHGRSQVKLYSPQGKVSLATIHDLAQVEIDAPGGRTEIREIYGEPKLQIRTRELHLNGYINDEASIYARLTKDGSLKFVKLTGESKLLWKKDHFEDPDPLITRGEVRDRAIFQDDK